MIHPAPQQHGCINHSGLPTFIPDLPLLTLDFFLSAATDDATEPPYMYLRLNKVCGCYAALTLLNRTPISEWNGVRRLGKDHKTNTIKSSHVQKR